jgi:hypothetical protein
VDIFKGVFGIFLSQNPQKHPFSYQKLLKNTIFSSKTPIFLSKIPQNTHLLIKKPIFLSKTPIFLSKPPQIPPFTRYFRRHRVHRIRVERVLERIQRRNEGGGTGGVAAWVVGLGQKSISKSGGSGGVWLVGVKKMSQNGIILTDIRPFYVFFL